MQDLTATSFRSYRKKSKSPIGVRTKTPRLSNQNLDSSVIQNKSQYNTMIVSRSMRTIKAQSQSDSHENQGPSEQELELEHLKAVVEELKRERLVLESLQQDNRTLKE